MGIIYVITSKTTGKKYVGQTVRTLEERIAQHKRISHFAWNRHPLYQDVKRYGWDDFEWDIYCYCPIEELNDKEMEAIEFYRSFSEGYNLTKGGVGTLGRKHSESTKRKISQSAKNRPPEYRLKLSEAMKGRKLPDQIRAKISSSLRGNNNAKGHSLSEEQKRLIVRNRIGKPLTEPHKAKIRESLKGRVFTEEWRSKIGAARSNPITINGITYPSRRQAWEALGISHGTFYARLKRGDYGRKEVPEHDGDDGDGQET